MAYYVDGKVVLITGGGRGIGRVLAERFANAGARVAIAGRNAAALEETRATIAAHGAPITAHVGDIAREDDVDRIVADVTLRHGPIDILVNNAGIAGPTAPVEAITPAEWDDVFASNVRGAFLLTRAVTGAMTARGSGHIIYFSSLGGGLRGYPLRAAYAASKAAVLGLMTTVAAELGPRGIRVNAITPGPVVGERLERVLAERAKQLNTTVEEVQRSISTRMPSRHLATAEEIADVVLFLVGPSAGSIVGQSINITGGIETLF